MYSENELEYFANIITELYSNQKIKDFKPTLNKGLKRDAGSNVNSSDKTKHAVEVRDYMNLYINYEYSDILGKENIETILKKTLQCNLQSKIELTKNGIMKDELKKTIDILKLHINNINAKNTNNSNVSLTNEIIKRTEDLNKLEEKYENCMREGNFEKITDYKDISIKCLKILNEASSEFAERKNTGIRYPTKKEEPGAKLYNLIRKKLGLDRKKNYWELEKEYEYVPKPNNLADIVCDKLKIEKPNEKPKPTQNLHEKFFGSSNDSYSRYKKSDNEKKSYVPPHQKQEDTKKEKITEIFDLCENKIPIQINLGSWGKKLSFENKKEIVEENKEDIEEKMKEKTKDGIKNEIKEENTEKNEWCLDD
jgi:hypothetical protein